MSPLKMRAPLFPGPTPPLLDVQLAHMLTLTSICVSVVAASSSTYRASLDTPSRLASSSTCCAASSACSAAGRTAAAGAGARESTAWCQKPRSVLAHFHI